MKLSVEEAHLKALLPHGGEGEGEGEGEREEEGKEQGEIDGEGEGEKEREGEGEGESEAKGGADGGIKENAENAENVAKQMAVVQYLRVSACIHMWLWLCYLVWWSTGWVILH